jgi:DMSO/TMAO reductase YedYZ molybdopterin-dependent catalytic subunit
MGTASAVADGRRTRAVRMSSSYRSQWVPGDDEVDPATWAGVSMQTIMDLVRPTEDAHWAVFYSLGDGRDGGIYYDAHPIQQLSHQLTMLGYDMNVEPLPFGHGAPLRNEVQLGFKQVKWIKGAEFVAHFSEIGGYGGYNQNHEFFGYRQSI